MKLYVLVQINWGMDILGIYTDKKIAESVLENTIAPYKYDVSEQIYLKEVESDTELDDLYYYV